MHYLVTGGAGFIGTHLSNYLISLGHQVSILDDMSFGDPNKIHSKANLIIGKIEDSNLCVEVTKISMVFFTWRPFPEVGRLSICRNNVMKAMH